MFAYYKELCSDGDIRLVNPNAVAGSTNLDGRVEICLDEQYGTVCSVGFDRAEAQVICGQLGYSRIRKQLAFNICNMVSGI